MKAGTECRDGFTQERSSEGEVCGETVKQDRVEGVGASDDEGDNDDRGVPVDRGWAWVICWSCFMVYYVYVGYDQMMSVLLVDIMRDLDASISVLSVMFSVTSLCYCLTTQVTANFLLDRITNRSLETAAAVMNVVATLVFVIRPSVTLLFVASCIKSASKGATLIPTLTLVGQYFHRRRGLAIVLGMAGSSLSFVTVPPLTRYLRDEYGLRGCFLLFSAVEMHAITATVVLRPIPSYQRHHRTSPVFKEDAPEEKYQLLDHSNKETNQPTFSDVRLSTEAGLESIHLKSEESGETIDPQQISDASVQIDSDLNTLTKTDIHNSKRMQQDNVIQINSSNLSREIMRKKRDESVTQLKSESHLQMRVVDGKFNKHNEGEDDVIGNHGNEFGRTTRKTIRASQIWSKVWSWIRVVIDFKLLKNTLCVMVICIYCLCCGGLLNMVYLPSYAIKVGVPPQDAVILLTVSGVCDIVGKIVAGFLVDSKILKVNVIMAVTTFSMGVVSQFVWLFTSFGHLVAYTVIQGLMGSVGANLNAVLVVEMLGMKYLAKTMAMCSLFLNVSLAVQHPIIGALIDYTNNYVVSYHYVGTMYLLVTILLLSVPLVQRFQLSRDLSRRNDLKK